MGTPTLNAPALAVWESYQRMRTRLTGRLNRELSQQTELSESDFEVLDALAETQSESVRAMELRCGLEWEKSRLSHQLRRMEQRGLLSRNECAEDNRGSVVTITPAGRAIAAEAKRVHEDAVYRYVIAKLTPEQTRQLGLISDIILEGLTESHK
jgi:DNA-binding MarR family transcriptional regulator